MLIDSVVIKLIRKGSGVKPDYSLTIHGQGILEYYGNNNVKFKGKIEEKFDRENVAYLLSEFKKSGFFTLNQQYVVDESRGRSFNVISISVPDKDGEMKTKTIKHYQDDRNVPVELKNLEDKIDEIADSEKWIKIPSVTVFQVSPEPIKESGFNELKSEQKPKEKKSCVVIISVICVVILLILLALYSGIFDFSLNDSSDNQLNTPAASMSFEPVSSDSSLTISFNGSAMNFDRDDLSYNWNFGDGTNSTDQNPIHTYSKVGNYTVAFTIDDNKGVIKTCNSQITVDYYSPYFTFITPTISKDRTDGVRSVKTTDFYQGDMVYIDYEFNNVTHNITNSINYDFSVEISIKSEGVEYDQYTQNYSKNGYIGNGLFYNIIGFQTSSQWPIGEYVVSVKIFDNISKKSAETKTYFSLNRVTPRILILTTASDVRAYQDYDPATSFEQFYPIFIYTEYTGINTTNENTVCNIQLSINVSNNEIIYYSDILDKTTVGNNAHTWWFTTNESWPTDEVYKVSLQLLDKNTNIATNAQFNFTLVERTPKILKLITASNVRAYQDYDVSMFFNVNDNISIYLEYKDIKTLNENTNCDITLKVNVTLNGVEYYSNITDKTVVRNNSHVWRFPTDESWPVSDLYFVNLELTDNLSKKSVSDFTFFSLN